MLHCIPSVSKCPNKSINERQVLLNTSEHNTVAPINVNFQFDEHGEGITDLAFTRGGITAVNQDSAGNKIKQTKL